MSEPSYKSKHVVGIGSFTRSRKLPFLSVLGFQLSKNVKSLQVRLNELLCMGEAKTVTASAIAKQEKNIVIQPLLSCRILRGTITILIRLINVDMVFESLQ